MKTSIVKTVLGALRSAGPYLLVEVLLPGGTLIAALMWLVQQRRSEAKAGIGAEGVSG